MKTTIYQKVVIGFGLGLLILIIIGIASYRFITKFSASAEMRKHTYEVITNIEHVSSLLNNNQADARGYVITGQDSILYLYPSNVKMINQKIKTIKELTSKEPDHQKLVETLEPIIAQLIEFNRQAIETRKKQGAEATEKLIMTGRGEQLMNDIEKLISELIEEESELLKQRDESLRVVARTTKNIIVAGSLLAIAIVMISVVVIWRELTRRKQLEEGLQKAQDELEIKVQERTAELAKSNEALLKANRAYKTLSICNQVLVGAEDETDLLPEICRAIVEAGGYRMALVGYAEKDAQKTVRAVAQMGYEENFFETVNFTWADTERGRGPLGTAIRTRAPAIFQDIANESKIASWREAALNRGYASAIGLPLIIDSDLLGALAIYSAEPYAFDAEEVKLLTDLADDLAYGIVNLRTRTKHKQAEEAIERLMHRNELILNSAGEGILGLDLQGNHTFVNPAAARKLGYEVEELIGKHSHTICHHSKADGSPYPEKECPIYAAYIDGTVYTKDDEVFWKKDGTSFPVRYTSTPILEDGNIIGAVVAFRDITERKQAEEALKRAHAELEMRVRERTKELENVNYELQALNIELELRRQEAETATRAKSDFLANMSHELRTPLNAIIGFSDMMFRGMTGNLTEQQIEYLGDIRESGELLLSLINDILDLSKVEAGKTELELSEFNIKDIIERSIILFKEKAMKHGIKLTAEVAPDLGLIEADERKIKQVIANLLSNAVKFTPDGGSVRVKARLVNSEQSLVNSKKLFTNDYSLTTNKDFIEISVEDTGIGIRPEDFGKLFQPFQQLEYTLTKKYEGTGLGLALCNRIVELHNGRIWVESEVDKGSKFIFVIPIGA